MLLTLFHLKTVVINVDEIIVSKWTNNGALLNKDTNSIDHYKCHANTNAIFHPKTIE